MKVFLSLVLIAGAQCWAATEKMEQPKTQEQTQPQSTGLNLGQAIRKPHLSRNTVFMVQNKLYGLGLTEEAPDGRLHAGTVKAINQFQRLKGMPATGQVDHATLQALGIQVSPDTEDRRLSE